MEQEDNRPKWLLDLESRKRKVSQQLSISIINLGSIFNEVILIILLF